MIYPYLSRHTWKLMMGDRQSPMHRRLSDEARNPERQCETPRGGMDAGGRGTLTDRYLLLYLWRDQAIRAGSVQPDGTNPGPVAYPVSARQCAIRIPGRVRLRRRPPARSAHASLRIRALGDNDHCDRDQPDPEHQL